MFKIRLNNLLAVLLLGLCSHVLLAQVEPIREPLYLSGNSYNNVSTSRALGQLIWEEDFNNGFPAGWAVDDVSGICPWVWSVDGSWGYLSEGGDAFAGSPINSTTAANGFLICDVDSANHFTYGQPVNIKYQYLETYVVSNAIDLSTHADVVLEFQQEYRTFFEGDLVIPDLVVAVSNDSVNWTNFYVGSDHYNSSEGAETIWLNISSVAANQATVYLKFGWSVRGMYWMVDDVRIYEAPNNDLELNEVYINTTNDTAQTMYYSQIPYRQAESDVLYFGAIATNQGSDDQLNSRLNVEVTGSDYYFASSQGRTVLSLDTAHFNMATGYSVPAVIGDYNMSYAIEQDQEDDRSENNSIQQNFAVTDTVYARDYNEPNEGAWYGAGQNYTIGNLFEINSLDTATSISYFVYDSNRVGAVFSFEIYDFNANNKPSIYSSFYSVKAGDAGNWITVPTGGVELQPGNYVVAIKTQSDSVFFALNTQNPLADPFTSYNKKGNGKWYSTNRTHYIRLNTASDRCAAINVFADVQDVDCFGGTDGVISLNLSGAQQPYSYGWSHGATTSAVQGLGSGMYSVTVSEGGGCQLVRTYQIEEPAKVIVDSTVVTSSTCGHNNGSIVVYTSGGTSPYGYVWNAGFVGNQLTGLAAGNYTVSIEDANNCETAKLIPVGGEPGVEVTSSITLASCAGTDGRVELFAASSATPYNYFWQTGETLSSIEGLEAGAYLVTVTDNNSCDKELTIVVDNLGAPAVSYTVTDVLCFGASNGAIAVEVTGGVSPYSYEWIGLGATTQSISNLIAGAYTFRVTDSNLPNVCKSTASIQVNEPDILQVNSVVSNATCADHNDGSINLILNGGTTPYTYNWSSTATSNPVTSLQAGVYTVTIADANMCSVIYSFAVNSASLMANLEAETVTCNGGNTGSITVANLTGGKIPYTYSWSNGQQGNPVVELYAGNYAVTISDKNNCELILTTTVSEPEPVVVSSTVTDQLTSQPYEGSITTDASGGVLPYQYNWWGPNGYSANTTTISNIAEQGSYTLVITDANACQYQETFIVAGNVNVQELPAQSISVYPNPADNIMYIAVPDYFKGTIQLYDMLGQQLIEKQINTKVYQLDVNNLPQGCYTLKIIDNNNTYSTSVIIR